MNATLDPAIAADDDYMEAATTAKCPGCGHRIHLTTLHVEQETWTFQSGATPVDERLKQEMVVFCADVGSVSSRNFAWASNGEEFLLPGVDPHSPAALANQVSFQLQTGLPVALGFECPLSVPVPREPHALGRQREGEAGRPWSAAAGAAALTTGLTQVAWVLSAVREECPEVDLYVDWTDFASVGRGLFIWEAFVSADAKHAVPPETDPHVGDAQLGAHAFRRMIDLGWVSSAVEVDRPLSLAGAAALWSGWTDSPAVIHRRPLVVKATINDRLKR